MPIHVIDHVARIPQRIGGLRSTATETTETVAVTLAAEVATPPSRRRRRAARDTGATVIADTIHTARVANGTVSAADLPIADYDDLTVSAAVAAIKDLGKPADIRLVVEYEEAHKNRQGVISAAQTQLASIAKEIVGVE